MNVIPEHVERRFGDFIQQVDRAIWELAPEASYDDIRDELERRFGPQLMYFWAKATERKLDARARAEEFTS